MQGRVPFGTGLQWKYAHGMAAAVKRDCGKRGRPGPAGHRDAYQPVTSLLPACYGMIPESRISSARESQGTPAWGTSGYGSIRPWGMGAWETIRSISSSSA